jgi:ribose 5-phosphate isomerase B
MAKRRQHIAMGSDERTPVTDMIVEDLRARGHDLELFGALSDRDPQWPNVARSVAEGVAVAAYDQGILLCWTGTGVSMAANKVPGARAALCTDAETAKGARMWNDANILCMSLRLASPAVAHEVLDAWFSTSIDESERENINRLKAMDQSKAVRNE